MIKKKGVFLRSAQASLAGGRDGDDKVRAVRALGGAQVAELVRNDVHAAEHLQGRGDANNKIHLKKPTEREALRQIATAEQSNGKEQ